MPPINALLPSNEAKVALESLPSWQIADAQLHRTYTFPSFPDAITFISRVAVEAEGLDHHPDWSNSYNRVQVRLQSHQLGGVSLLCVELARSMEAIAVELGCKE